MRRTLLLLSTMILALLLAGGVALAANIVCQGGPCTGTEQDDLILGSLLRDQIEALGGIDQVNARTGDDEVSGGADGDQISGAEGGDLLEGNSGDDDINGGPGTTDGQPNPPAGFTCSINAFSTRGDQTLLGEEQPFFEAADDDGNDRLSGGIDNDFLAGQGGRNDLSGNGGADCFFLAGDPNERVSGGDGGDLVVSFDDNGDDISCGAGIDVVFADEADRVAADCEPQNVIRVPALRTQGATPEAEVTITTPEGTITM